MVTDDRTYAELIAEKYAGQDVEIYIGDDMGSLNYADHDVSQKSVIYAKVISGVGEMLTVEATVKTATNTYTIEVDIHSWGVKGIMKVQSSGVGLMHVFGNQEIRKMKR